MAGRRRRGRQRARRGANRNRTNQSRLGRNRDPVSSPNNSMTSPSANDGAGRRSRSASPNPMGAPSSTLASDEEDSSSGSASGQDTICPICRNHIEQLAITNCNHRFCHDCIHRWTSRNGSCPSCRQTIVAIRHVRPNGIVEVRHVSRAEQIANRINETTTVMMVLFSLLGSLLPEVASYLEQMEEIARELNLPAGGVRVAQRAGRVSGPGSRAGSASSSPLTSPSSTGGAISGPSQDHGTNRMRETNGAVVSVERAPSSRGATPGGSASRVAFRLRFNGAPSGGAASANNPSGAELNGAASTATTATSPAAPVSGLLRRTISQGLFANSPFNVEAQSRAADSQDAGRVGRPAAAAAASGQTPAATPQNSSAASLSSGLASLRSVRATLSGPNLPAGSTASTIGQQTRGAAPTASQQPATTATTTTTTTPTTTTTTTTTTTSNGRPATGGAQNAAKKTT